MREIRLKQIIPILSICTVLTITGCSASAQHTFNENAVVSVNVSKVQKEMIGTGEVYTGVVKPSKEISIISKISGKVAELPFEVGSKVKKGQVLLKLDDKELQNSLKKAQAAESAAKANIQSAEMGQKSGVVQSESGVVQAKAGMLQAKTGMVQAEDNLTKARNAVKLAENSVKDTELVLKKTEQALKDASANHDRMKQLFDQSMIAKVDLEKSETVLVTAQASFDSAVIAKNNATTSLATAKKAQEAAQKAYDNASKGYQAVSEGLTKAQEQVELSQNTASVEASTEAWKQAQVGVEIAKDVLNDSVITSPIEGIIGLKNTDVGEMISTQSPALVVVNLETVKVLTYLPATSINNIKIGDQVQVKTVSVDFVTKGTVKTISPIDAQGKGYPVEIEIPNPDTTLKIGMIVDLQFIPEHSEEGMFIPSSAVIEEDGKTFVFVAKDKHPKKQEIQLGDQEGSMVTVIQGLTENDLVITNNIPVLSEDITISY